MPDAIQSIVLHSLCWAPAASTVFNNRFDNQVGNKAVNYGHTPSLLVKAIVVWQRNFEKSGCQGDQCEL